MLLLQDGLPCLLRSLHHLCLRGTKQLGFPNSWPCNGPIMLCVQAYENDSYLVMELIILRRVRQDLDTKHSFIHSTNIYQVATMALGLYAK